MPPMRTRYEGVLKVGLKVHFNVMFRLYLFSAFSENFYFGYIYILTKKSDRIVILLLLVLCISFLHIPQELAWRVGPLITQANDKLDRKFPFLLIENINIELILHSGR
jgi:hypothetical protein